LSYVRADYRDSLSNESHITFPYIPKPGIPIIIRFSLVLYSYVLPIYNQILFLRNFLTVEDKSDYCVAVDI
ncbi:hypothetical protein, partial [uncultured Nostoc sp.]|uniref:hypothetical protein n=1 Tax=uncultured Nostoc sp. TaxID=340711 RepID=UPI0035C94D12